MKDGLSSFDVLAVTAELQSLVGGHVDKVYQREEDLIFKVNVPSGGHREMYARVGKWLCLRETPDKPETPPPFAMNLRRYLDNARIAAIEQRGFDRIVTVSFDRGTRLVFEMFGKGNVVLVEGDTALAAFRKATFRDRTIGPGMPYGFPPPTANPLAMTRDAFAASMTAAKGPLVKVLASGMNLGGLYGEEICLRAGAEKSARIADPADARLGLAYDALQEIARAIREAPQPEVVLSGGAPVDVTPIPLRQYASSERRGFPTLSEALAFYLDRAVPEPATPQQDAAAKLRRRIEAQEASVRELRDAAVQAEALAHFLYAHYAVFDDLIRRAREGTLEAGGMIAAIDHDRHVVRVAVGDITQVDLDWTRDVNQNAQLLFERKKEALAKAERAVAAIEDTQREIDRTAKAAAKVAKRPTVKATRRFWFEAYRWFFSTEGFLVIGGRDAKTNDAIVKKHLKDGDRYVHADIHGAPSCVIKDGMTAGEATLAEACAFALAWSKAWSAGLASGSAFWVLSDQVSKQAESGEYVARGAFVIRGKRNYVHDMPVRVAVGEIEHEGHRKVMAGPVEALAARSKRYVVLEPGEETKEGFARRLAAAFGVPLDEVARILPPGKVRVARAVDLKL